MLSAVEKPSAIENFTVSKQNEPVQFEIQLAGSSYSWASFCFSDILAQLLASHLWALVYVKSAISILNS
jgi:hypothetical protein